MISSIRIFRYFLYQTQKLENFFLEIPKKQRFLSFFTVILSLNFRKGLEYRTTNHPLVSAISYPAGPR